MGLVAGFYRNILNRLNIVVINRRNLPYFKHNVDLKGLTMKLHIPIELANQIIGYLGTRPYQEVYQLIDGMKEAAKPPMTPLQEVPTEEQKAA